jgi:immune inhibitor A
LTPFVVLALLATAVFVGRAAVAPGVQARTQTGPSTAVRDGTATGGSVALSARDYYYNLAAPLVPSDLSRSGKLKRSGNHRLTDDSATGPTSDIQRWWAQQVQKHSGGFPRAAKQLARAEQKAAASGVNPKKFKHHKTLQTAKLLTVLVEFNPAANDDFSGFSRIIDINSTAGVDCVTEPAGTLLNGPVHNDLENPATIGQGTDNNTFWVRDFNAAHYRKLLYTTDGITRRVRPDLTGPDGQPQSISVASRCATCTRRCPRGCTTSPVTWSAGSSCRIPRATTRPTAARPAVPATSGIPATRGACSR